MVTVIGRSLGAAGVQGQMDTGFMKKFLEVRGIVAVVGWLLATVVSWSVLVGVAHGGRR